MALSLDDKLLGEKVDNYCSSSEDEAEEGNMSRPNCEPKPDITPPVLNKYSGRCENTGVKGVIEDWRRFKQLETQKREEEKQELKALTSKLAFSCRTTEDDDRARKSEELLTRDLQKEWDKFEDTQYLKEYRLKRLEEMKAAFSRLPKFGTVFALTSKDEFLSTVDSAHPTVSVVVHFYDRGLSACNAVSGCFLCLSEMYPTVKFCELQASCASLSANFQQNGLPSILVYKNKQLIGNFVRISDELGDDFFASDLESFLLEYGMLPEKICIPKALTGKESSESDDSDFNVD